MTLEIRGNQELVQSFGDHFAYATDKHKISFIDEIFLCQPGENPPRIQNGRLNIVIYGTCTALPTKVGWRELLRFDNNWHLAAQSIAELYLQSTLYILIPLEKVSKVGAIELIDSIIGDAFELLIAQKDKQLAYAEKLLLRKLPHKVENVISAFSNFWKCNLSHNNSITWIDNSFSSKKFLRNQYKILMKTVSTAIVDKYTTDHAQEILRCLNSHPNVECLKTIGNVLVIQLLKPNKETNEPITIYMQPLTGTVAIEGAKVELPQGIDYYLKTGKLFKAFCLIENSLSGRTYLPDFFPENSEIIDFLSIKKQDSVKKISEEYRHIATVIQQQQAGNNSSLSPLCYQKRWYLIQQAIILLKMPCFDVVRFEKECVNMVALDVVNTSDENRPLEDVIFSMTQNGFSLISDKEKRPSSCQSDACYNYRQAVKTGKLRNAAEIVWQHVMKG